MQTIQPGRYRHFKGNEYTVLDVARHSETLEELVVYRQEYGEQGLWVRPAAMFAETVEVDGHAYTRTEEQVTLGEWEPDPLLVSQQETPSIWPRSTPYPDSRTRSVGASIRPEIVRVLLSCGRREETP